MLLSFNTFCLRTDRLFLVWIEFNEWPGGIGDNRMSILLKLELELKYIYVAWAFLKFLSSCFKAKTIYLQDTFHHTQNVWYLGNLLLQVCPYHTSHTDATNCYSSDSLTSVKNLCDGKSSCSFQSSHGTTFGTDPCGGTYKYTEVHFICV